MSGDPENLDDYKNGFHIEQDSEIKPHYADNVDLTREAQIKELREAIEKLNIENALLRGALSEIIIQVNETRKVISERK